MVIGSRAISIGENKRALAGFFVSGAIVSFLGAVLPAWGHHVDSNFLTVGYYFLFLNLGFLAGARIAYALLPCRGIRLSITLASLVACASFLYLGAVGPPWAAAWRDAGLFSLGASAGLLNASLFHAISPSYRRDPASTVNLGGILLGLGCVATALLVSGTFYVYTVPSILVFFAAIPGFFAIYCWREPFAPVERGSERPLRDVLGDFKDPVAVLFSLLLFFQFGNEWSIAGWLPIFTIRRLGVSPKTALEMLALYWSALLVGRILARAALTRVRHMRLLFGSAVAALFGCLMLALTTSRTGAAVAVLLIGFGFASIYPVVVEKIGRRFTYYHPGFYNGIFSFALTGGLLAPWLVGYFAEVAGIQAIMLIPAAGTCIVVALVVVIWIQARHVQAIVDRDSHGAEAAALDR